MTTKATSTKTPYETPALDKGLDILELLASQADGLTKSEVARRLNRSVSEIFRMLLTLEKRGYIAQIDGERYQLTLHLFKLVQEHPPTERLLREALPIMHRLALQTNQSCHLGVLEGIQAVILAQVNAPGNTGFYVRLGSVINLMDASTGQVILAHQPATVRARVLGEWRETTRRRIPVDLAERLQQIRERGFEKHPSFEVEGVLNISFPIFALGSGGGEDNTAAGAISVPYIKRLRDSVSEREVVAALRRAAAEISRAIGGKNPPPKAAKTDSASTAGSL